jgi:hypothetical protein
VCAEVGFYKYLTLHHETEKNNTIIFFTYMLLEAAQCTRQKFSKRNAHINDNI